jgi:hypothetical protein
MSTSSRKSSNECKTSEPPCAACGLLYSEQNPHAALGGSEVFSSGLSGVGQSPCTAADALVGLRWSTAARPDRFGSKATRQDWLIMNR